MPSLDKFVRHAERFGTGLVYETAVEVKLDPRDLGCLARHLRRVDRRWRLSPADRLALAERLVTAGVKNRDVVDMAGVSHSTVSTLRAAGRGLAEMTPQPTGPCALFATETGGSTRESTRAHPVAPSAGKRKYRERSRQVSNRYQNRVAEVYGGDLVRTYSNTHEQAVAPGSAQERRQMPPSCDQAAGIALEREGTPAA